MKLNVSRLFASLFSLGAAGAFALIGGCSAGAPGGSEQLGESDQQLTAAQCDYFDINGTIQICHQLGNGKFKILKLNEQACVNAHGTHAADYVTSTDPASPLYDPTCNGQGCLPEAAPCDGTLDCCEGSACTNGTCQPTAVCPCAVLPDWGPANFTSCTDFQNLGIVVMYTDTGDFYRADANQGFCNTPSGQFRPTRAAALKCVAELRAFQAASTNVCSPCTDLCPASECDVTLGQAASCQ